MAPPRSRLPVSPGPIHYEPWTVVALLALGTILWLPRFQERLPGGPCDCPAWAPEASPPSSIPPGEPGMRATLAGALGDAALVVVPGGVRIDRAESLDVRWLLCPLAMVVGGALAGLALKGLRRRLRRPKAAAIYAISTILGLLLAGTAARSATYRQSIRISSGSVEFETAELLGLRRSRHSLFGAGRIEAWRTGSRYDLIAVPAKAHPKGCARVLRVRALEPDLLAILNQSVR